MRRALLFTLYSLLLVACKVEVKAPEEGGDVVILGDGTQCSFKKSCELNVDDAEFLETVRARSARGFRFDRWKESDSSPCSGKKQALCRVSVPLAKGKEADVRNQLIRSSKAFSIEPVFVRDDSVGERRMLFEDALSRIRDVNLQACIAEQQDGKAYADELLSLRCINKFQQVKKLEGLQHFAAISAVHFESNRIANLRPLAKLPFLVKVKLKGEPGRKYSSPYNLERSGISDLQVVTDLQIIDYGIDDASILKKLDTIWNLDLSSNSISDTSFISSMNNLRILIMSFNPIDDISVLAERDGLIRIDLMAVPVKDFSPLAQQTFVEGLNLTDTSFGDTRLLQHMTELNTLLINGCRNIRDLAPLAKLTKLRRLYLSGTDIRDYSPLSKMSQLVALHAWGSGIPLDVELLKNYRSLESFWALESSVSDISFLANNPNLTDIHLGGNDISDISPLAGLKELQTVQMSNNKISDVSAFKALRKIGYLDLETNRISKLGRGLDNLQNGLVRLSNNPLSCKALDNFIQNKPDALSVSFNSACVEP